MAESPDLSELVRRTMEANARFYQGWVELSVEYFRGITEALSGAPGSRPAAAGAGAVEPLERSAPGAVILEAEEGETASGAFLVSNDLGRTLECELVASEIANADGEAAPVRVAFEPAAFDLEPGEQKVVQATVPMGEALEPGVAYSGTFGIKGLEGFSVPAVVRRTHTVESPIDRVDSEEPAAPKNRASRGKATEARGTAGTKKASAGKTKKASAGKTKKTSGAAGSKKGGRKSSAKSPKKS